MIDGMDAIRKDEYTLDFLWFNGDAEEPMWEFATVEAYDVERALQDMADNYPEFKENGFMNEDEAWFFVVDYLLAPVNQYYHKVEDGDGDGWTKDYESSDFVFGRDGGWIEEAQFIIKWFKEVANVQ